MSSSAQGPGGGARSCPSSCKGHAGGMASPRPQPAGASVLRTGRAGFGPSACAQQHRSSGSADAEPSPAATAVRACRCPSPCRRHAGRDTAGCRAVGARPSSGSLGAPARLMPLCLPGHLNPPAKDTALQPLCGHGLARGVLEGTRPETAGSANALRGPVLRLPCAGCWGTQRPAPRKAGPPRLRPSARVEAGLPEKCGHAWPLGPGSVCTCSLRDGKGGRETSSCIRGG